MFCGPLLGQLGQNNAAVESCASAVLPRNVTSKTCPCGSAPMEEGMGGGLRSLSHAGAALLPCVPAPPPTSPSLPRPPVTHCVLCQAQSYSHASSSVCPPVALVFHSHPSLRVTAPATLFLFLKTLPSLCSAFFIKST